MRLTARNINFSFSESSVGPIFDRYMFEFLRHERCHLIQTNDPSWDPNSKVIHREITRKVDRYWLKKYVNNTREIWWIRGGAFVNVDQLIIPSVKSSPDQSFKVRSRFENFKNWKRHFERDPFPAIFYVLIIYYIYYNYMRLYLIIY